MPFRHDVLLNGAVLVKGIDISIGGIYVYTGRSIPVGTKVGLKFTIMGGKAELGAEVRSCHPSVGMGMTFIAPDPEVLDRIRTYMEGSGGESSPEKKKVLLIGGDAASRRITKGRLVQDGCTVLDVATGAEGLQTARDMTPDAVLLDMELSDMDGFDLLGTLKREYVSLPVVVISARGGKPEKEKAMSSGAECFLVKMLASPAKVADAVKKALGGE